MDALNQIELIYQFGIFVGILLISLIPYLNKKQTNPDINWDNYYTLNMVYSYIIAIVGMFILLQTNPLDLAVTNAGQAFGTGLVLGLASTPTVKYLRDLFGLNSGKPDNGT